MLHTGEMLHPKITSSFTVLHAKTLKKRQNTVFGYKKGSKLKSNIGSESATPKLYMNIFTTFFPKWSQHRKPEGGGETHLSPPAVFEVTI